jgi:hypothetical protein
MAMLLFWIYITIESNSPIKYSHAVYSLRNLPPLSSKGEWGIFDTVDDDSIDISMYVKYSRVMLYSPNTHQGVNELMRNLSLAYPQVELHGRKNTDDVQSEYEANIFHTWVAIEFDLSDEQITTGRLVDTTSSSSSISTVNYKIRVCPGVMV